MMTPEEIRLLGMSAPQLLKLLALREARVLGKIYGEFKNGKADQTLALAEFVSIRDQINDINSALRAFEKQEVEHATTNSNDTGTGT